MWTECLKPVNTENKGMDPSLQRVLPDAYAVLQRWSCEWCHQLLMTSTVAPWRSSSESVKRSPFERIQRMIQISTLPVGSDPGLRLSVLTH